MERITRCTGGYEKHYDPAQYRVVFFSSAPIGVPFLEALVQDHHIDVVGVVTGADKPSGRGMKMQMNVVQQAALNLGIDEEMVNPKYTL